MEEEKMALSTLMTKASPKPYEQALHLTAFKSIQQNTNREHLIIKSKL